MARRYSKWATPDRQANLVKLFTDSKGFCVYGHKPCPIPEHHYDLFIESLIADWQSEDRAQSQAEWQAEREQLHSLGERREPTSGRFSAIAKDIFYGNQAQYYLIGLGISGLTFKPFAKVRLASSYMNLYIDIDLSGMSKAQRRKAIRYGRLSDEVNARIRQAVRHYLDH